MQSWSTVFFLGPNVMYIKKTKTNTKCWNFFLSGPTTTATKIRPEGGAILALFIY